MSIDQPTNQNGQKSVKGRIGHFVAKERMSVMDCLQKHFRMDSQQASQLLSMGSIYLNKRRVTENITLNEGAYLRIHLQPRHYPVESIDWKKTILYQGREFLVVNKPAGIPVHATLDNMSDNVLHQLRLVTKHHLLVTQRLDIPVAGLMVLAKTPEFQRRFNQWLGERVVEKRYLALVETAPPLGEQVHYMEPSERSPKRVSATEVPGWIRCELRIHKVDEELIGSPARKLYEVDIELLTGRTHQIRAQLSALGHPIVGDRMYGSRAPFSAAVGTGEAIALFSRRVAWPIPGAAAVEFHAPQPW